MTIATTQLRMGYQSANQRPACRNCFHHEKQRASAWTASMAYCRKGGFLTNAGAVCKQHQPIANGGAQQ